MKFAAVALKHISTNEIQKILKMKFRRSGTTSTASCTLVQPYLCVFNAKYGTEFYARFATKIIYGREPKPTDAMKFKTKCAAKAVLQHAPIVVSKNDVFPVSPLNLVELTMPQITLARRN